MARVDLLLEGFSVNSDQGRLAFCGVTLIRGSKTILVDVAHTGRRGLLLEGLTRFGLSPAEVDTVVLTHSHWDHMLNVDVFKHAEFLLHPWEREYARSPHPEDWATPDYTSAILERYQLREIQEGDEIDDGVSVLLTPGHTRGSISLVVQTETGPVVVCGDALPTARTALQGTPYLVFWDADEAKRSARKILDAGPVLYPGHDRPFRHTGGQIEYLKPTSIRFSGPIDPLANDLSVELTSTPPSPLMIHGRAAEQQRLGSGVAGP